MVLERGGCLTLKIRLEFTDRLAFVWNLPLANKRAWLDRIVKVKNTQKKSMSFTSSQQHAVTKSWPRSWREARALTCALPAPADELAEEDGGGDDAGRQRQLHQQEPARRLARACEEDDAPSERGECRCFVHCKRPWVDSNLVEERVLRFL